MFNKISQIIGLTKTEINITLFIVGSLILGLGYKTIFVENKKSDFKIIDYSERNTFFDDSANTYLNADSVKSNNKKVDYKQEVLDFNTQSFNNIQKKNIPAENSININTAELRDFIKLPGIGEKTAQKIIEYRNTVKKFRSLKELLNVKGIGPSKFEKIKKYIFID